MYIYAVINKTDTVINKTVDNELFGFLMFILGVLGLFCDWWETLVPGSYYYCYYKCHFSQA